MSAIDRRERPEYPARTLDVTATIIDLAVRYTWALDTKHLEDLENVFTPDATADLRGVECNGVDEIIARIGGAILRLHHTQHLVGNQAVHVAHGGRQEEPREPAGFVAKGGESVAAGEDFIGILRSLDFRMQKRKVRRPIATVAAILAETTRGIEPQSPA